MSWLCFSLLIRPGAKHRDVPDREESFYGLVICQMSLDVFEIDAKFSAAAYSKEGKPVGGETS
jgi:hypothetical protein